MTLRPCVLLLVGALLAALPARAQMYRDGPPPQHRLVHRDLTALRLNPLGLNTDARLAYRFRLFESSSLALRDNFVSIGLAPSVSAGYARVGAVVEVQPLTVLQLWALYEVVGYFGANNLLQSFPDTAADYSDTELGRRGGLESGAAARHYAASGTQLLLGANLQLKVGNVAVRNQLRLGRPDLQLRDGDTVFYEIVFDLLVPNRGWFFNNDADLLWQFPSGLTVGVRHTMAGAFFEPAHVPAGGVAPGITHRAGPLVAYTFSQRDGARFNEPTVLVVLNWWLAHPYRTGRDVSQALPYFVVGFAFNGDLLGG